MPIQKLVVTGSTANKHVNVSSVKVFDTGITYSRVIGLQASSRQVDVSQVLARELSPIPTSMFTDSGEMRICKAKSSLKKLLQVSCSTRKIGVENTLTVIDESALLWCVQWPEKGSVEDFINTLKTSISKNLQHRNVNLGF